MGYETLHYSLFHMNSSKFNIRVIESRKMRCAAGITGRLGDTKNTYKNSVGNPVERKSLRKPRRRWKDNIEMDFEEKVCEDVDWIHLSQDTISVVRSYQRIEHLDFIKARNSFTR
jgi:hypothetical protein